MCHVIHYYTAPRNYLVGDFEKVEEADNSPVKMVDSGDTESDHLPGSCHLPRHGHETWRKWTDGNPDTCVSYLIIFRRSYPPTTVLFQQIQEFLSYV